jgi:hypothetical protein
MRRPRVSWVALACVTALLLPREAHAYLDPGTGSMLLSALISIVVTAGFALQSYGYRLLGFLRGDRAPADPAEGDGAERDAAERGASRRDPHLREAE